MSEEIKVVYDDILKASRVFASNGKEYSELKDLIVGGVGSVSGRGALEPELNDAIDAITSAFSKLHEAIGISIQEHARKLQVVHEQYHRAENDLESLLKAIDDPSHIAPAPPNS